MPTYNFRKDAKLYIVVGAQKYLLSVYPDLTFSQTFNETRVPVKTLHQQFNMFEQASITKTNPGNFSFTIPIILEQDMNIIMDLLTSFDPYSSEALLNTFDLYVENQTTIFKLQKSVMESGVFRISKDSILLLSISGSFSKLETHIGIIPGVLVPRTPTMSFSTIGQMEVLLNGVAQEAITSVSIEFKNEVSWIDFATLQKSLVISNASATMVPEAFVVGSRTLSGTIQQYVTNTSTNFNTWSTTTSLSVKVGNLGQAWTLEFNIPSVVYTNRSEVQDLYIQSYDFRMNTNSANLADVIKKRNV